jgi:hypothetical protein
MPKMSIGNLIQTYRGGGAVGWFWAGRFNRDVYLP